MKRMLCLWFPNWPIQRLVVEEPKLRKTHLVLFRRDSRKGQLVAAASPLAMKDGVQPEMPVSEVKQLLRHSGKKRETYRPNHRLHPRTQYHQLARQGDIGFQEIKEHHKPSPVVNHRPARQEGGQNEDSFFILEHNPVADREALEKLVDSLHCFSPIVGVEQVDAPECCFLDPKNHLNFNFILKSSNVAHRVPHKISDRSRGQRPRESKVRARYRVLKSELKS